MEKAELEVFGLHALALLASLHCSPRLCLLRHATVGGTYMQVHEHSGRKGESSNFRQDMARVDVDKELFDSIW